MEQSRKTWIGHQWDQLEFDQSLLDQRQAAQHPMSGFHIRAFEHEHRLGSIRAEVQLADNALLVQFPGAQCLGSRVLLKLLSRRA